MAGSLTVDTLQADSTSTLVLKNGVANTPPTIQDSAGTQIGTFCRAWVNFNGTGTVAIRASFNVTSITDNGTGNYTANFTNALPDANYAVTTGFTPFTPTNFTAFGAIHGSAASGATTKTTSAIQVEYKNLANDSSFFDAAEINIAIFR